MRKKVVVMIILIGIVFVSLLLFILFKSKYTISDNLVSLTIKEESLDKTKATLLLANHADSTYIYGSDYSIEKKIFGTWYIIIPKDEIFFNLMGYDLQAKESKEIEIDWEDGYGKLGPGKYRIIKKVFIKRETFIEVDDIYIGAEFIIE